MRKEICNIVIVFAFFLVGVSAGAQSVLDVRNIATGLVIPDESYSDQPYVIKTNDGAWLCVLTTSSGHEGTSGQHVITQRSFDQGKTWIDKVDVEPGDGPEASYAVLLKASSGRIFVFYNHNTDNVRTVKGDDPPYKDGVVKRVDSQGYFVFKYSDDNGKTWSRQRYTIPVREFEIDRKNPYGGEIRYFWNVGKAFDNNGTACVPLIKVQGFGEGFFTSNEGVLLQSPDLFTVKDPAMAKWNTLPDGEIGIRTPPGGGPIAAEQSFVVLSDGSLFCVYRTIDGYPAYTYSRDRGHTWETPQYMKYADGRLMKHPRAANFVWKCENGKYLYWFHNHGGRFIREHPNRRVMAYDDRNPVWIAGGTETDSPRGKIILWSQPEILLYDDDPVIRMSYPDLIEEKGNYYVTETQKDIAAVHQIDEAMLNGLWNQLENKQRATDGLALNWSYNDGVFPQTAHNPVFPIFYTQDKKTLDSRGMMLRNGYTIEIGFLLRDLSEGQILLDTRTSEGQGWFVRTNDRQSLEIVLNDGQTQALWSCDEGILQPGRTHYASIIIDGGAHIISFVTDGALNDGSSVRQFGWGRFSPYLKSARGTDELQVGKKVNGVINEVTIYNRAINISEALGNYRAFSKIEHTVR